MGWSDEEHDLEAEAEESPVWSPREAAAVADELAWLHDEDGSGAEDEGGEW